jgi:hypothetical protein
MASAEAEEGENRYNHDNQADKIDETVHVLPPCFIDISLSDNPAGSAKFHAANENLDRDSGC